MRVLLYIVILIGLLFVPLIRTNLADLLPIEAVAMYLDESELVLETDSGNIGRGNNAAEAIADLKDNIAAVVYLDTVTCLIVSPEAVGYVDELRQWLEANVDVFVGDAAGKVKDAAEYIAVHDRMPDWDKYQRVNKNFENIKNDA